MEECAYHLIMVLGELLFKCEKLLSEMVLRLSVFVLLSAKYKSPFWGYNHYNCFRVLLYLTPRGWRTCISDLIIAADSNLLLLLFLSLKWLYLLFTFVLTFWIRLIKTIRQVLSTYESIYLKTCWNNYTQLTK